MPNHAAYELRLISEIAAPTPGLKDQYEEWERIIKGNLPTFQDSETTNLLNFIQEL